MILECHSCQSAPCWWSFVGDGVGSVHGNRLVGQLDFGQHAGEDFQPQVLFVPEAVGPPLEHPNLVVRPSTKPSGILFSGLQ